MSMSNEQEPETRALPEGFGVRQSSAAFRPISKQVQCRNTRPKLKAAAFTMIELILVMTILTIAVALTAPSLANFFRGRALESEARRLLALSRQGQNRAVSEGIP